MVDLPKKKVGIIACSGEELPEGTVTRLAALKVLEQLRPDDTVTICLPLFLAGGEGDRAFARFYPTIAIDGCERRCAARATALYSGKPAESIMVHELFPSNADEHLGGKRRLNTTGMQAVQATAERVAALVDDLLGKHWDRREGKFSETPGLEVTISANIGVEEVAACSCGSGIPIQELVIGGEEVALVALPLIFEKLQTAGKAPCDATIAELMETVKIYNPVSSEMEQAYREALSNEYTAFWTRGLSQ